MAIYISKNAINKNPFVTKEIDKEERKYPVLTTPFLRTPYLVQMMSYPKSGLYLSKNNYNVGDNSVRRIKEALNFIHSYSGSIGNRRYQIPGGSLFETGQINSNVFDSKLELAISEFQRFAEIKVDGKIGPETLHWIDSFLSNEVFNADKIIGKSSGKPIKMKSGELKMDQDGNEYYLYGIGVEGKGYSFQYYPARDGDKGISVVPIDTLKESKNTFIFTDAIQDGIIVQHNIQDSNELASLRRSKVMSFTEDIRTAALDKSFEDLDQELDIVPPQALAEEQAYLYLVSEGDTVMNIIEREYYNNQEVEMINPISDSNEVIYTFKAQKLHENPETRKYDAKLQFYINLLYYLNIDEKTDGSVHEYGMIKNESFQRYQNDHLNDYEMHGNIFDENNPETALSNYHRFLRYQESKNANSKIQFDENGNVTSFLMDKGKYIYIPSREFADSLYYELNFRHKEMLVERENDYDYLVDNAFIETASKITIGLMDWIHDFVEEVTEVKDFIVKETTELLEEAFEFIKKVYEYLKEAIKNFPRGIGAEVAGGIGITWGYPIATDVEFTKTFYRKMTPLSEFTLVLREQSAAFVGVDTGIGYNFAFKLGKGKSRVGAGIQSAAGFKAGLKPNIYMEYEFPLRKEETAVMVMLFHFFGDFATKATSRLAGMLNGVNLDPAQYLTKLKMGVPFEVDAWANAAIGIHNGQPDEDKNITIPKERENASDQKDKSFLSINNIWGILSGAGVNAESNISIGIEFEYKAKYGNKPRIPEISGRVPSEVEIKNSFGVSGSLNIGLMGSLLQKILLKVTGVESFLGLLNFDKGYGVAIERKWQRNENTSARDITLDDVNISEVNANNVEIDEVNGKASISNEKGTWETQFCISRFSGDVDRLFVSGAETELKFDTGKIVNLLKTDQGIFSLNKIEDILLLVHSIEIQYKPGFGYSRRKNKKLFAKSILETMTGIRKGMKGDFITTINNGKDIKKGFTVYAGAYVKVEFKIQNLVKLLTYYLKRWYFVVKKTVEDTVDAQLELRKLITTIIEKDKDFKKDFTENEQKTKAFYEKLYAHLESYMQGVIEKDGTPENFKQAAQELFKSMVFLLKYLLLGSDSDDDTSWWEILDLKGFAKGFIAISEIIESEVYFEAKLGVSLSGSASVAEGAKVRLSFFGEGSGVYIPLIIKGNKPVFLEEDDPEKPVFDKLAALIDIDGEGAKSGGIRQAIITLPS